jgi:predicted PurR-regulated permease PerM
MGEAAPDDAAIARHLRGIDRTLRVTTVATAILLAIWLLKDVVLLAFAAVLVACVLRLASDQLSQAIGIGQGWALLLVVLALVSVVGLLGWWRGPMIADQAVELGTELQKQAQALWSRFGQTRWGTALVGRLRDAIQGSTGGVGGYLTGVASSTLGIVGSALVVAATGLFLAIAPGNYVAGAIRLLPPPRRQRGAAVLAELGRTLQLWFAGQLVDMLLVTILIGAGLFMLDVPLAMTLALFAGLLNFVPFVGALAGAVPAVLVAFGQSPSLALWVAGLFLVVQTIEGNIIAPLIQKRTVSLPPAITIFSQTVLGTLFGIFGVILATPITAATLVFVRMSYVESVLEEGK